MLTARHPSSPALNSEEDRHYQNLSFHQGGLRPGRPPAQERPSSAFVHRFGPRGGQPQGAPPTAPKPPRPPPPEEGYRDSPPPPPPPASTHPLARAPAPAPQGRGLALKGPWDRDDKEKVRLGLSCAAAVAADGRVFLPLLHLESEGGLKEHFFRRTGYHEGIDARGRGQRGPCLLTRRQWPSW